MISIIVPVYKAEGLLPKCVDSVRAQDYEDWELILVDDGSPDGSGALCDRYAGEDGRIRVFHKENGGVSSARNRGMAEARGEHILFLDADDYLAPNICSVLLKALEESGGDTAGCGVRYVDEHWQEGAAEAPILPAGVHGREEIMSRVVDRLLGDRLSQPALNGYVFRFLFDRRLTEGITFLGAYLEDELFLMEYFCRAEKLVTVDEPLYYYYWNPASATHRHMPGYRETFYAFLEAKGKLAERYGLAERMPLWRENTCWAGLLIGVSNEFAPGNGHSAREQKMRVREWTRLPEMDQAIQALVPGGMGRNKKLVADLLRRRMYGVLTLLYRVKNRG